MNELAPLTMNQRAYYDRCFKSWFNVAEGGKRGSKKISEHLNILRDAGKPHGLKFTGRGSPLQRQDLYSRLQWLREKLL
jgi:hypothetical protein